MPSKWRVLGIVGTGVFMCTLDSSIVNVSLPPIAAHFGVPVGAQVEWVIVAYLVIIASTLLTIGRLADRIGHRPIWLAGLTVFTVGSALCGAAPTLWLLIAARILQGIGGSLLMAVSPAMLTSAFPPTERGRALGLNSMIVALGITAGPALGGWITETASWRWIFYVNVPIGIGGIVATLAMLPGRTMGQSISVAIAGAVFVGLGAATAGRALLSHPHDPTLSATFLHGYRWALLVCAGLSAAAIITSLLRGSEQVHSASRSTVRSVASSRISPAT